MAYDLDFSSDLQSLSDAIEEGDLLQVQQVAKPNELQKDSSLNRSSSASSAKLTAASESADPLLEADDPLSREIALQAALQAARQQEALMRKALEEKERALNEMANQCENLGNELEDSARKMDHLSRKVEKAQSGEAFLGQTPIQRGNSSSNSMDISELFNADEFDYAPRTKFPWQLIGKVIGGGVAVIAVLLLGVALWPKISSILMALSKPQVAITEPSPAPSSQQNQIGVVTAPTPKPNIQKVVEVPKYTIPPVRDRLSSGGNGPYLLKLPGGKILMGSRPSFDSKREEYPQHEVTLKPFYMARYETSFDEYELFANATGREVPEDGGFGRGNRPVMNVAWSDATAYADWLAAETGQNYYLPSESQWEYATKAYTNTTYWWGSTLQKGQATCFGCSSSWDGSTAPVGSFKPNPFGLYDTIGNVMEWVQDCFNNSYNGAPNDGSPWMEGDCNQHVVRGGAFNKPITMGRSTARFQLAAKGRFNMVGFRVARD